MVELSGRPGITVAEIAERYRRSARRVADAWVVDPAWRERVRVVGYRGQAVEYDPDDVHKLLREWVWLPPEHPEVAPNRLLTLAEIAAYTGFGYATVKSDASRHVLGPPDAVDGRTRMWRRSTVDARYWARQRRK